LLAISKLLILEIYPPLPLPGGDFGPKFSLSWKEPTPTLQEGILDQNLCFLGVNPPLPLPGGDFRTEVLVVPRITLLYPSGRELSAEL
jgi:hypothetical protein